jgi:hypothetical protein
MPPEVASISTICKGAVPEVFNRELQSVLRNIRDRSVPADMKRQITLTFDIEPFADRSGAIVSFSVKSKLGTVESVAGNVFIGTDADGEVKAFAHDPTQEKLFRDEPTPGPKQ